jgi:hypothetical protein
MAMLQGRQPVEPTKIAEATRLPAIPARALFIGSRQGNTYGMPAPVTLGQVVTFVVINGIVAAVSLGISRHWQTQTASILCYGTIFTSLVLTISRFMTREVLRPTACVVCSKAWSDIVRYAPRTDNLLIAVKLLESGCEQGHVCRKCGALLCGHCMLMRGGACPKCGTRTFINAMLCRHGRFQFERGGD